jgi:hypothetical protein
LPIIVNFLNFVLLLDRVLDLDEVFVEELNLVPVLDLDKVFVGELKLILKLMEGFRRAKARTHCSLVTLTNSIV